MAPSDTDDEEERLDCVHDIHGDGDEADVEEVDADDDDGDENSHLIIDDGMHDDRPILNDSSMEGDVEDG